MIRQIQSFELPLLLPLARVFHNTLLKGNLNDAQLDEAHFLKNLKTHIDAGTGFVIVAGEPIRGMISGIMFDDMSTAERCCMEFFWFVDPAERGSIGMDLLAALEKEAWERGAKRVLMAHLVSPDSERFNRVYARKGFVIKEQIFVKQRPEIT